MRTHDTAELRVSGEGDNNIRPLGFIGSQKIWNILFSPKKVRSRRNIQMPKMLFRRECYITRLHLHINAKE